MTEIALEKLLNQERGKLYRVSTLLRKRSAQQRWEHEGEDVPLLRRVLTWVDILSCSICMTIGAGIFVIAGNVAREDAGPAVVFSFLLSGTTALISSFCYSEFSARVPVSGSTYSYTYVTLGEFVGWMAGCITMIEYTLGPAAIAKGISDTCVKAAEMMSINIPPSLFAISVFRDMSVYPMASVLILVLSLMVLFGGIKGSAIFCKVMSFVNIGTIVFIVVTGIYFIDTSNWVNFFPYQWSGVLQGASKVFFAFAGFENCTTLATEVKNPKKNMPRGVIGSLVVTISLYLVSSLVITGMINYTEITETPFVDAFDLNGAHWAAVVTAIGSILCMVSTILSALIGLPRILFQMSRDGLLGISFSQLNRFKVPYKGTYVIGGATCLLAFLMNLEFLNNMLCCGVLINYTLMNLGVISLRFTDSERKIERRHILLIIATAVSCLIVGVVVDFFPNSYFAPICLAPFGSCIILMYHMMPTELLSHPPNVDSFLCPFVPFLPCLGMLFNIVMIVQLGIWPLLQVLVWSSIASCVYFYFGIRHSKLNHIDPADQFYY